MNHQISTLAIEAYGVANNGIIRLKLDGLSSTFIQLVDIHRWETIFRLQYKVEKRDEESVWKSQIFYGYNIIYEPTRHVCVRIDTDLYDYNVQMRLRIMIPAASSFPDEINNTPILKDEWLDYSNCISINIPSLMIEPYTAKLKDWVQFRMPTVENNTPVVGEIINITKTDDKITYRLLYNNTEYEPEDVKFVKNVLIDCFVDLGDSMEADNCLLVGDRLHNDNDVLMDEYSLLVDIFETYAYECMWAQYFNDREFISMAKCVSLNVINFLWLKSNKLGYKINCMYKGAHYDRKLRLFGDREYVVARAHEQRESNILNFVYYCDICLCRQGTYYWMLRCSTRKEHIYSGHDICIACGYDMVKKYNQLHTLLIDLLKNELTRDCIQSIAIFVAGDIVKL
eukprot:97039_1